MFNQRLAYIDRLQLLFVYVFMRNNLETMKNKHEMSGKGKTVVFPCVVVIGQKFLSLTTGRHCELCF